MISYLLIDCIEQFEFEKEGERVMAGNNTYDAGSIAVLEGLEAVRKRPGMYIGSVSTKGLNHLIYEIVDNAVDEALAGFCTEIRVVLEKDGTATVTDNGRGIPVDMHQKGISAARLVFTTLHAGGKFDDSAYKTSGGLHGVGSSVVNALSTYMDVKISRDGAVYHDRYERGVPVIELENGLLPKIGKTKKTGTTINFLPDDTIFEKTKGIDVVMYLALGWLIIISIKTLWEVFSRTGVILLISGGIAYTLQMVGQKYAQPSVASIVMSLESVFAVLAGWIVLGELLKPKEIMGCVLVFAAVILAQVPGMKKGDTK